ncbi:riboflavin synthase [Porcipelethomonas sp.]|uniref:riboflavin synthase n=1 Tax=Porcipelethomonas sp. TaxID=2981675 RepID=UPI003EFB1412
MFTGIIEEIGTVTAIKRTSLEAKLTISSEKIFTDLKLGDSVAVNGVCLTAALISGKCFTADVMNETFSRTSLAALKPGGHVNLERAMAADGRFGGHIVAGHTDGTGTIKEIRPDGNAIWFTISASPEILKYIVKKGSVAVDGISLTVAEVFNDSFTVSTIPHTVAETILSEKRPGDIVNLENDIIGKYVERLMNFSENKKEKPKSRITLELLSQNGF